MLTGLHFVHCRAGPCREHVAALKRLLRESFAEQLGVKQRLDAVEKAAAAELEAADEFQLQLALAGHRSGLKRSTVRLTGTVAAAGVLPWSQVCASGIGLTPLTIM